MLCVSQVTPNSILCISLYIFQQLGSLLKLPGLSSNAPPEKLSLWKYQFKYLKIPGRVTISCYNVPLYPIDKTTMVAAYNFSHNARKTTTNFWFVPPLGPVQPGGADHNMRNVHLGRHSQAWPGRNKISSLTHLRRRTLQCADSHSIDIITFHHR